MSLLSRADRSPLSQWWWTIDRQLLVSLLVLMILGIIMVSNASPSVATRIGLGEYHFVFRHLFFLIPNLIVLIGISFLSPEWIRRIGLVLFVAAVVGMVMSLVGGHEIKGAQRWIRIFGFSVQPSEFLKPAFVVAAAWFMARQKEVDTFPGNKIAAGLFGLSTMLLVLQPDMGMTFLLAAAWMAQIFLAGFPFALMFLMGGLSIVALFGAYFLIPHFQSRVNRFLNPDSGDTYQIDRALEAFEKGGLLGVGPGEGDVKKTIPDAHADFIFAVAGEEMGFVFIVLLIALYGYILWRGFQLLKQRSSMFEILAIGGLLTLFGLQTFIHMGANVHLLPTKGMTLPFISYGGSSIIALGISMGMLLGLTRRSRS